MIIVYRTLGALSQLYSMVIPQPIIIIWLNRPAFSLGEVRQQIAPLLIEAPPAEVCSQAPRSVL